MPRGLRLSVVAALALAGGGCGTCVNVTNFAPPEIGGGQRRIYGGVVWDVEGEYRALTTPQPRYHLGVHLPMILEYLIDIPLSAIGDTVTLPITVGEALGLSLPPFPPDPVPAPRPVPPGTVVVPAEQLPPPREVGPATKYPSPYMPAGPGKGP